MKKVVALCMVLVVIMGMTAGFADTAVTSDPIKVMADGKYLTLEVAPLEKDQSVYLPLRATVEALGGKITDNGDANSIEVVYKGKAQSVKMVNNPSLIVEDSVSMVKYDVIADLFGAEAKVDQTINTVLINKPFEPFSAYTFDHYIRYDQMPKKAVSMNAHTTELMLALGLEKSLIGTAYNNAKILPEYEATFNKIPVLAEKYPSFEVLLDSGADFVFGRSSVFTSSYKCATMDEMLAQNIDVYVAKASYTQNADFNDVYEDFTTIGRLFNVENESALMVAQMQKKIADVAAKVNTVRPVKVFVYDFGSDKAFTAGKSLETYIIQTAGGKNVFDDINKTWSYVNWETVVDRNPDYIVINDYGNTTAAEKIEFLKSQPMLKSVNAIKNNNFVVVTLPSVFPGIRVDEAVENIAKGLHPTSFK
jgi:iron complex transport system substrate-binding protein